jgi:HAD superfamily hydrolase (TIGR01548 family)
VVVTEEDVQAEKRAGNANNDWELTRRLLDARGVDAPIDDVIDRYQELYLGNGGTPGLREGEQLLTTHDILAGLGEGRKLGVVTGRPREEAQWFLTRYKLLELIDAMVCLEDGPLKPDPFPVTRALELLECHRAWMVGDTPDDIRAAAAAGVVPIGVVAPGDDPDLTTTALREAGAVAVIPDLQILKGWLP